MTYWVPKSQNKPEDEENCSTPTVFSVSEEKMKVATSNISSIDGHDNEGSEKGDPELTSNQIVHSWS